MNMELWLPIEGYENYSISTHGNVKNIKTNKILKTPLTGSGYKHLNLYYAPKKYKTVDVHKLMGLTFLSNPFNYPELDHIDRNPLNNNIDNLRWVQRSINQKNKSISKNNTSGNKGVDYDKERNKWRARWYDNDGKAKMKRFDNIDDACLYLKEMHKLYGYTPQ